MKRITKNKIILIVILCIISCSIGVYAATIYKATDVVYNASDGTSMNVNDALNELYNKSNNIGYPDIKIYYNSGWHSGTCYVDVSFNIPNGYNYLSLINNYTTKIEIDGKIVNINPGEKYSVSEKDVEKITIYGVVNSRDQCIASGAVVLSH